MPLPRGFTCLGFGYFLFRTDRTDRLFMDSQQTGIAADAPVDSVEPTPSTLILEPVLLTEEALHQTLTRVVAGGTTTESTQVTDLSGTAVFSPTNLSEATYVASVGAAVDVGAIVL